MEDNKNTPQPSQESSGIMELFASMIILQFWGGGMPWENKGRNLMFEVLKNGDDGKVKVLAAYLGADEEKIKQRIDSIRKLLKVQAEKNGMSMEELIGMFT